MGCNKKICETMLILEQKSFLLEVIAKKVLNEICIS